MFRGFKQQSLKVNGISINFFLGGHGRPLLLLHGYPQTHVMWHAVAPLLSQHFTVVVPDLRGYGDSDKPKSDAGHNNYSKREMAKDQVAIMEALGHQEFAVVGHDRGARVAHRMTLDNPNKITRLAVLDIVPTLFAFEQIDMKKSLGYYHWFFLAQPFDLPERLIEENSTFFLHWSLKTWGNSLEYFTPDALAEYERCFSDPKTIHATCEDYRAGASIDLVHDRHDKEKKITCPTLALWGDKTKIHQWYDVIEVWRKRAPNISGGSISAHHFLAEEKPDDVARALFFFLRT